MDPRFVARERQPGLDLLRAAAVLLVICYHAGNFGFSLPYEGQRFGWIGVDLFFVLSGYLIGGQLLAPLARGERLDVPRFFRRRALRILPAYFVVLAVYVLLPSRREWPEMPPLWKFLCFVQNIGLHGGTAFSHAWSLCVEGQFYLALPFLLVWLVRRRQAGVVVGCGAVLAGLALRGILAFLHPGATGVSGQAYQTLIYYPTWTRLDPLVFGAGLAAVEQFRPRWWACWLGSARWLWVPALAAIAYGLSLSEADTTIVSSEWQFPLVGAGMAGLLLCAVSTRLPFRHVAVPGATFVASIAYSVYLSHKLTMHWVGSVCAAHGLALTSPAAILMNLAAMLLVGTLLFLAVERPFLLWRRRR